MALHDRPPRRDRGHALRVGAREAQAVAHERVDCLGARMAAVYAVHAQAVHHHHENVHRAGGAGFYQRRRLGLTVVAGATGLPEQGEARSAGATGDQVASCEVSCHLHRCRGALKIVGAGAGNRMDTRACRAGKVAAGAQLAFRTPNRWRLEVPLSARNQIPGTVTRITEGEATANVELDASGQRLVASITVEAARELGLTEGKEVTAIIKASDVLLATDFR